MDSLANYGSDDDCDETNSEKLGTSGPGGSRGRSRSPEADANYDEVQMDLSEESNNNNSAEDDDATKVDKPSDKKKTKSPSRDDSRAKPDSSTTSCSSSRYRSKRDRSEDRDHRRDDDKDRYRKYESKSSKYDSKESSDDRYERSKRDDKGKSRDEKRKRRSSSRDRRRSGSKERRRSSSRDKRRSSSKERRRSRSPRRPDYRRRSDSKERDSRGGNSRYGKRFDRTSNKMAQLEKLGIEIKTPDAEFVTPQMLLQRSMDEQVEKVKHSTGIELPKYYNPAAMNPARYADQIQKRRLLWQKKQPETETTDVKPMGKVWEQTTFAQDADGKVASKFKRLMGIKETGAVPPAKDGGKDILKKQEEMFSSMEQQYEVARTATHTMRGVGLGFGTYTNYPR